MSIITTFFAQLRNSIAKFFNWLSNTIIKLCNWLSNSILLHICRWTTNNVVSLIAIPIAILAIIITLSTDFFKHKLVDIENTSDYFKIKTYYNTFKDNNQRSLSTDIISYNEDKSDYSHLFFIDITSSIDNEAIDNETIDFQNYILSSVSKRDDNVLTKVQYFKLKNILYHNLLQMILTDKVTNNNIKNLYVCFFDGEQCESHKFKNISGYAKSDAILDVKSIHKDDLREKLGALLYDSLSTNKSKQSSNYEILFNEIKQQINEFENDDVIVSILSDFDHHSNYPNQKNWNRIIRDNFIKRKSKDSKFLQYNLIILPVVESRKENQNLLIQTISKHTLGHGNIVDINLDDFRNGKNHDKDKDNFVNRINASFYSINSSNSHKVHFRYPQENIDGSKFAEARIKLNDIKKWKIISSDILEDTQFDYNTKTGTINGDWLENENEADILDVNMQIFNPQENNEKYRLEAITQHDNIITYPIEFKMYIQSALSDLGIYLLHILSIIITICFIFVSLHIIVIWNNRRNKESYVFLILWVIFVFGFLWLQFVY